jgi:hypothetical protein
MSEKIGKDVLKKSIRKSIERANQISIQTRVLEELGKRKMTSQELQEFIEGLNGIYYLILPRLKESGLLKTERDGWTNVYSLKQGETK